MCASLFTNLPSWSSTTTTNLLVRKTYCIVSNDLLQISNDFGQYSFVIWNQEKNTDKCETRAKKVTTSRRDKPESKGNTMENKQNPKIAKSDRYCSITNTCHDIADFSSNQSPCINGKQNQLLIFTTRTTRIWQHCIKLDLRVHVIANNMGRFQRHLLMKLTINSSFPCIAETSSLNGIFIRSCREQANLTCIPTLLLKWCWPTNWLRMAIKSAILLHVTQGMASVTQPRKSKASIPFLYRLNEHQILDGLKNLNIFFINSPIIAILWLFFFVAYKNIVTDEPTITSQLPDCSLSPHGEGTLQDGPSVSTIKLN